MLRIHSGLYKGRKLKTPSLDVVRPTTGKLKLSFFDILRDRIKEAVFFDGFAGTGNVGIEALSRGAAYVVFNDHLPICIKLLKQNLEKIGIPRDYYRIIRGDYNRTVISLSQRDLSFDIIFLDPPYQLLEYADPLKVVYKRGILKPEGIVVLERPTRISFQTRFFQCYRSRVLGNKVLDFFRH